ncbi:PP2C family protein-serine/threonine phosphatase [Cellulomonas carbonis]|uniref:Serine/threonine protein phosphatase PstP n=1 Tax=Cellulomonas carbonis T26 TaxID=947969 RepID=A0A0A0BX91_9CELL|nr:protein phosphatase 2C domain-containing protein [Cellulomonas carbonis]KGM12287.1 serine/threonine protein phosphatase [Cellulomonas carbonis T26]GGC01403.1 serine/threonine protein phosphatase [Cellulomonas carbonis]
MSIALRYAARSDVGLVRAKNDDSGYAGPHLLVVADGMGGHAGGDVASSVAVAHLAPLDDEAHGPDDALAELTRALTEAHEELLARAEAEPELAGLGTTVTALLRSGNKLAMAHIGDSRAYLLRDGVLSQVTTDHSFVQHLVTTGKITQEEADHHPQRSVLLRVLGDFDMDISPDMSVREARPGDRWLLCSDGLSGVVSADTLAATLAEVRDVDACADQLVQLSLRGGAPDNVTVVVSDVVEVDQLPDGAAPSTTSHVVGAAAKDRRRPTLGGQGAAARAAQHSAAARAAADDGAAPPRRPVREDEEEPEPSRLRRRLAWTAVALVVAGLVALGAWLGYGWTQDQYYVGVADGNVAIYRGIPQEVGGLVLSRVVERSDVRVDDLPGFVRDRLEQTIPADDLPAARERVASLEQG